MLPSTHDATTTKPHIGEWCVYNKAQCNMCFNLMAKNCDFVGPEKHLPAHFSFPEIDTQMSYEIFLFLALP